MDFQPHLLSPNPFTTIYPDPLQIRPLGDGREKGSEAERPGGGERSRVLTEATNDCGFTRAALIFVVCRWSITSLQPWLKVPHHTSGPNVNWQTLNSLRLCYWIPECHRRSVFNYKPHYFHCGLVVWRLESTQHLSSSSECFQTNL